jgi:hypothetical protein
MTAPGEHGCCAQQRRQVAAQPPGHHERAHRRSESQPDRQAQQHDRGSPGCSRYAGRVATMSAPS